MVALSLFSSALASLLLTLALQNWSSPHHYPGEPTGDYRTVSSIALLETRVVETYPQLIGMITSNTANNSTYANSTST
ncbi:hypothetical protein BT96DRAFT_918278 [Gymnopus androsaceus JB14]|uniref:Uncharacterized protein n=1 Tax=Gymnopus androsaceus JB14 TaxID=1447944 RepID=A0A6A4I0C6_9AGAR|nr:hypothetical protein BT96DRAFT_918278 [Gymnopus androsaceus JB14]